MTGKPLAALFVSQLLATAAWAQTAPPAAAAATQTAPDDNGGLQDIVVTAQRREESAQRVPVQVTAFAPEELNRRNLNSLEAVAQAVPQMQIARSFGGSGAQITLRGISSAATSIGIEQSVAVVVDSVYYGQGRVINEGFFDLAGLEVLKGPQALFFGKNATAGLISIRTANPGDKLEVIGRAGYEFTADQVYGEGIVSAPLSDTFGIRIAVRGAKQFGGLFENQSVDQPYTSLDVATGTRVPHVAPAGFADSPRSKELLGRVTLQWKPSDRVTATVKGSGTINDTNTSAWNTVIFNCPTGVSAYDKVTPCRRDFILHQNYLPPEIGAVTPFAHSDGSSYNRYRSWSITGDVGYTLDPVTWTNTVNYNRNTNSQSADIDGQSFGPTGLSATERTTFHAFSAESRLQTTLDSPVNGLLGFYYQSTWRQYDQTALLPTLENSAAPAGYRYVGFAKDSNTRGKTYSVYGQLSWKIVPTVELAAGGRYIHETKNSFFIHPYVNPALRAGTPGAGPRYRVNTPINADQTFNNFSPQVNLTWQPTSLITVYAAYKTAYKSGGFSNSGAYTANGDPSFLAFNPETVSGFEGGVKTTLMDRQLRLNAGLYSYRFKNFQTDFLNALTFDLITRNAGKVKQDGVEAEFEFAPHSLRGWRLRGSANYNRSRYGDFILPCYVGQRPAAGCTLSAPQIPFAQDGSGRYLNNAPKWVGSLGSTYTADIGDRYNLELAADGRYSGSYLTSTLLNPLSGQKSYVSLDATATLSTADRRWQLSVIGRNLTNRFIVNGTVDGPSTGSGTGTATGVLADQRGFIALPRTVTLQATFRY